MDGGFQADANEAEKTDAWNFKSLFHTRDEAVELFKIFDVHSNKKVDFVTFSHGLRRISQPLGIRDDLLPDIMSNMDLDGDGYISESDFCSFVICAEIALWELFCQLDASNRGVLIYDDFKRALNTSSMDEACHITGFFAAMDDNADGIVTFSEFRDYLLLVPCRKPTLKDAYLFYHRGGILFDAISDEEMKFESGLLKTFGYFISGGLAGVVSRTVTAPFDRLKVYLISNTSCEGYNGISLLMRGKILLAIKQSIKSLLESVTNLYHAGGLRTFFVGNGLNVVKIFPESSIRFGCYEVSMHTLTVASRLMLLRDIWLKSKINRIQKICRTLQECWQEGLLAPFPRQLFILVCSSKSCFLADVQVDTIKFRTQFESSGFKSAKGTTLVYDVTVSLWRKNGILAFYRGLTLGVFGMIPYSAIDLFIFETLKRTYTSITVQQDIRNRPGSLQILAFGAISGSVGATCVYPLNVIRTRYQAQGTKSLPLEYDGILSVVKTTYINEGLRGFYRGLSPNLMKVAPSVSISFLVYERCKRFLDLS